MTRIPGREQPGTGVVIFFFFFWQDFTIYLSSRLLWELANTRASMSSKADGFVRLSRNEYTRVLQYALTAGGSYRLLHTGFISDNDNTDFRT